MKKYRFCFYAISNFEKAEHFLSSMEENGYRVNKICFNFFYSFIKVKPKKVNYFLTYSPLGSSLSMHILEMQLKGNKAFNSSLLIKEKFESPAVYRICNIEEDLSILKNQRNNILRKICISKGLSSFLGLVLMGFLFVPSKQIFMGNWLLCLLLTFPLVYFLMYYLIQFLLLSKKKIDKF